MAVQTTKKRLERSNTPEAMTLKREKNFNFQVFPQTANALWLAETGEAMAESYVGELITETARSTLGIPVNPHMFRTAAATTSAIHAGDMPHLGSAVLHHTHPTVTLENYNRASCISAGRALREVIQRFRDKGT